MALGEQGSVQDGSGEVDWETLIARDSLISHVFTRLWGGIAAAQNRG
jgi:hypothetical protein